MVTINRRSERRLIAYGDDFLFEKLPAGTRVIYPPPPLEALPDPDTAIRYALLHPQNADPLFAQLNPNMRVTIAIDDISLPLPQMRRPISASACSIRCCRRWRITASTTCTSLSRRRCIAA